MIYEFKDRMVVYPSGLSKSNKTEYLQFNHAKYLMEFKGEKLHQVHYCFISEIMSASSQKKIQMLEFQCHRQNYQKLSLSGNQKSEKFEGANSRNLYVVGN